jgi:hypothetical protein
VGVKRQLVLAHWVPWLRMDKMRKLSLLAAWRRGAAGIRWVARRLPRYGTVW